MIDIIKELDNKYNSNELNLFIQSLISSRDLMVSSINDNTLIGTIDNKYTMSITIYNKDVAYDDIKITTSMQKMYYIILEDNQCRFYKYEV